MNMMSLTFAAFTAVLALVYFLFPKRMQKYQWTVLLAASLFFYIYTCNKYVIYMAVTTLTTFFGALLIEKIASNATKTVKAHKEDWSKEERKAFKNKQNGKRKAILSAVLVLNFGILAVLKYSGFAATTVFNVLHRFGIAENPPSFKLILPLGISFYTFQAMGYIIDVYRSKFTAERNFGKFTLFVSFFPQIVQGPIAFYSDLAHQLYEPHRFNYDRFKSGGILILWGLFKKLLIADRAVLMINHVVGSYDSLSGTYILMGALMYALQLYADFSGGIDVCRGIAEIFGIDMAENFRRPYFSKSLTEYWHRWHITLGEWLRTYLFYPISISKPFLNFGKRLKKKSRHIGRVLPTSLASLITFAVIGIWHGANWKYVAFGLWNGGVIMLGELMKPLTDKLAEKLRINTQSFFYGIFAMLRTFFLVLVGYYFDIADGFKSAMKMLWLSVTDFHLKDFSDCSCLAQSTLDKFDYLIIILGAAVIFVVSVIAERKKENVRTLLKVKPLIIQWPIYLMLIFTILIFGYYGPNVSPADFVYMQF